MTDKEKVEQLLKGKGKEMALDWIDNQLWFEEMADINYQFDRVRELEDLKRKLEKIG